MATKVWAHRGASGYAPENTIPAFKLAVEQKADGVELDVHLSSDGKLMVIHDETVDRTSNGTGRVVDMTCQELKKLDFSNGMPGYKDVRIPTLKEVYGLLKNTNLTINVEIKCDVVIYYGIWDKVIELEREMGMQGRIIYSSFNHYVLMKLREVDPKAPALFRSHGRPVGIRKLSACGRDTSALFGGAGLPGADRRLQKGGGRDTSVDLQRRAGGVRFGVRRHRGRYNQLSG